MFIGLANLDYNRFDIRMFGILIRKIEFYKTNAYTFQAKIIRFVDNNNNFLSIN